MIEHVNADETAAQPALGSFMRLLAHELGNPVATIRMSAEMLQSSVPPEMHEQLSSMILEEAMHLEELIGSALFYATIGAPSPINIEVRRLLDSVAEGFPSAVIAVRSPDSLQLNADPAQLGRMIGESIANAIEAGANSIELSAEQNDGDVNIRIVDNGGGLPAGADARVFEPFYTTRESKLGLGLTIARRIAALHGGSAEVRSLSPSGTDVSYRIPKNR